MIPPFSERPAWLKSRGYLHITPKIDVFKRCEEIYTKVHDETFVADHGFFPLIHSVIKERKYKKIPKGTGRAHSYKKGDEYKKTAKLRPLHYATHIDAMIFGCYAEILLEEYETTLKEYPGLTDCVIAYRKIGIEDPESEEQEDNPPGKSTIHFAHEAFEEIKKRSVEGCVVLMFDIKSFFSELNQSQVNFLGTCYQANNFCNLNRKNATSVTPLKLALKFLILELKDSAFAFVFLLSKKFKMLSR